MVFALPLPVGVQSVCELLDVRIDKDILCEDVKALLNEALTDELKVLDVYLPESKFASIGMAKYHIELTTVNADEALADAINNFFSQDEVLMTKHTKSGEKEINIIKMIHNICAEYCPECNKICVDATLSAGSESLNPEFIITSLKKYGILPEVSLIEENYDIVRTVVLDTEGNEYR